MRRSGPGWRSRPSCRARREPGAPRSRRQRRWTPLAARAGPRAGRPVFRDVDLVTPEHGVDALAQAAFLGQLQEELEGFVRDAVLRVIEVDARGLSRQTLAAVGIIREELAEMQVPDFSWWAARAFHAGRAVSDVFFVCMYVPPLFCLPCREQAVREREALDPLPSPTGRNPPRNALALSPTRQPGGSSFSFLTLPPPRPRHRGGGPRSGGPPRPRHVPAISSCPVAPMPRRPT